MKYIILVLLFALELMAVVVKSPIISVNLDENIATINIDKINVGMSGFISHEINKEHSVILKNIEVIAFDTKTKEAKLKLTPYTDLKSNALPNPKMNVKVGDTAILAFGYTRGLLIAPSDEIYYRITRSVKNLQWIHSDIFATLLSSNGHPTPLRKDFTEFATSTSVGIIFMYIDEKLFTLDSKSFKILAITDAKLKQEKVKLPFSSRVEKIEANWFGEGSSKLTSYEPYYYELLTEANPDNTELQKLIKNYQEKASK